MNMEMGRPGDPWLGQIQTISPPVANSLAEAVRNAPRVKNRELSKETLQEIGRYLAKEDPSKPYSDRQVISHMGSRGYEIDKRDLEFARTIL